MQRTIVALIGVVLLAALSGTASAQAPQRGSIHGLGGITFGTETSSVFAGGAGFTVARNLEIFGELGRMQNVLPKSLQEDLDDLASLLSRYYGVSLRVDASAPAFYGIAGARALVPTKGKVRPFVEGGLGFARLSVNVDASAGGIDVSDEVEEAADIETETKFLLTLGGGVSSTLTERLAFDVGYRYTRIFTEDPAVNSSAVYAGVRFGF